MHARVSVRDGRRIGWAQIIEFASGDLAWYSKQGEFLIWGLRAQFIDRVRLGYDMRIAARRLPRSSLRTREVIEWWAEE